MTESAAHPPTCCGATDLAEPHIIDRLCSCTCPTCTDADAYCTCADCADTCPERRPVNA